MGFKSFAEVDRLTIPEYELLMESVKYREVDKDYRNHLQAYLNFAVKATKGKQRKPVYRRFKRFYDYEAEIKKIQKGKNKKSQFPGVGKFLNKGE